ncbi:MAG: hypothetical protein RI984_1864 [Pseudomonadota bacterium]|jgi:preprotein translocase subunit SecG
MNSLLAIAIAIQVLSALLIIGLVLLQHGKGADMGAAFGSGASGSLFGASGSSNFLSKLTGIAAAVFFISTLALSFFGSRPAVSSGGVMEQAPVNSPQSQSGSVTAPTSLPAKPVGQAGEIPK